jgi:pyruvate kinase
LPFEKLGLIQKQLIKTAKKYKRDIIVSTQIIESANNTFIPFRSDITDMTNIILDGATGIMLCRETAVGQRPTYAINCVKKIIHEVEKQH